MKVESQDSSHKQILKSSSIIAFSSAINVIIGLFRMKLVAVLLGPVGVGLVGLLQNLVNTASTISAFGLNNVGTRQIAEANSRGELEDIFLTRVALFWGTAILSVSGAVIFWIFRDFISNYVLDDIKFSGEFAVLSVGIFFTVVCGSQRALLNGMRRILDIAKVTIFSAIISTLLGLLIILFLGEAGLSYFVLSVPVSAFFVSLFFVLKLESTVQFSIKFGALLGKWRLMLKIGSAFMFGSLISLVGQLIVRALIKRELGPDSLGYFQASWVISATYLGFVLGSMATDYYPRLTATISEKIHSTRLVNEQSEVCILLAAPVLLFMLTFSNLVIIVMYSSDFSQSVSILRWQIMGDVLKILSWPLGFVLLASGSGRSVFISELAVACIFIGVTWLAIPFLHASAAGLAYFSMYIAHLPIVYFISRKLINFSWSGAVISKFIALFCSAIVINIFISVDYFFGLILGVMISAIWLGYSFFCISDMVEIGGRAGNLARISRELLARISSRFRA